MKRPIKFRARDINGNFVYGLLTKKKIRSSGEIRYAIATGNCTAGETVPVTEKSIAQLVGFDSAGNEVYEGDIICGRSYEFVAELAPNACISRFKLKEAYDENQQAQLAKLSRLD